MAPVADDVPAVNLEQLEPRARAILPQGVYDYFAGGAEDEVTLRANREAFSRYRFRYRVLTGSPDPDPAAVVVGHPCAMPVVLAPTATQRMAHPEGERAAARAAAEAGVIYSLSTLSTTSMEDVAAVARGPRWFQVYVYKDRGLTLEMVGRAAVAGYTAILLTVDAPVLGRRERDLRNGFTLPPQMRYENLIGARSRVTDSRLGESGVANYFSEQLDPGLAWQDVEWLVGQSRMPVLLKGVVRGDDARRGVEHGARGIVVSNHGGRQLDSSLAALDALPEVVRAVKGAVPVLVDGGVRRGTDVLKALALGAQAVLIGRPILWGLAVGGEAGVSLVLRLLREELVTSMRLLGVSRLGELSPDLLLRT